MQDSEPHFFVYSQKDQLPPMDNPKVKLVTIEGQLTPSLKQLYIQLNHQLQLGGNFGKNLDALFDSLADLSWLDETTFYIEFTQTNELLKDETDTDIIDLLTTLDDAANAINDEPMISSQNRKMKFYIEESERFVSILDDSYLDWAYLE